METVADFIFLGFTVTANGDWNHDIKRCLLQKIKKDACPLEEKLCKPRQYIKKQTHHFADKGLYSQRYGFFQ